MGKGVKLGQKYRDQISGFEGVATGRHEFLYGCVRVTLEGGKDGELKQEVFDEQRLVGIEKSSATSGGPHPVPPPRSRG